LSDPESRLALILNIAAYHFVEIADPPALREQLRARCEALGLLGTVLVASEGVNLFLAGHGKDIHAFLAELDADHRFATMAVKFSDSECVPFRRLRVKLKKEIITFRKSDLAPSRERAPVVPPKQLARWLDRGCDDAGRDIVLLDTRNDQEVAHGSFVNALTLPIAKFTELPEALETHRETLLGKTIISFCTGGIRCEKAALWMLDAGYENVLQLEGGILGYFEQVGAAHYQGGCFVFDERVALAPDLKPVAVGAMTEAVARSLLPLGEGGA
jgi:UPF0176 protein